MLPLRALLVVDLLAAGSAHSQSAYWRDATGKPIAETESMKSKNDFAGSLLATSDADWEKKWNSPPDTRPKFTKADVVPYGKQIFILTFFANPKPDAQGNVHVRCDIRIIDPMGKASLAQKDLACFDGRIEGSPYNMYLSAPVVGFSGDPGDPPGTWTVEVHLRDQVRRVELPLRTTFKLK